MPNGGSPHERVAKGLRLHIRLTPRSARDAVEGVEVRADGRAVLKARVRAVPEDGKANAALMRLVADTLDVPVSCVKLEAGATSRVKTVLVAGDAGRLEARLTSILV